MKIKTWFVVLLLAVVTGCGGGSASVGVGAVSSAPTFIIWPGNSSGDQVVDVNNHAFAFFADTGCLFNFQTGLENPQFCLTPAGDTALYGGLLMRVVNVRSATGVCIAVLVDAVTAHFVDIELDAFGREVVFITALHPDFCFI